MLGLGVLVVIILGARFFLGGSEDEWRCVDGQWTEHGRPSTPKPTTGCGEEGVEATVYYHNEQLSSRDDCSQALPLKRKISDNSVEGVLRVLFAGPTEEEKQAGYGSPFGKETAGLLIRAKIERDTAYVDMKDFRTELPSVSSSCGSAQFTGEVEATLRHNFGIKGVVYAIEGNPETFYEFIQVGCSPEETVCERRPFEEW